MQNATIKQNTRLLQDLWAWPDGSYSAICAPADCQSMSAGVGWTLLGWDCSEMRRCCQCHHPSLFELSAASSGLQTFCICN